MQQSYSRQQLNKAISAGHVSLRFRGIKPDSENSIQANFFAWIDLWTAKFPELALCYAIPNGSNKSKMQRFVMSVTGLRSGVPDVHLPIAVETPTVYRGLWIEFKRPGAYPSPNQREWIQRLRSAGHRVEVCRSWAVAANIVIEYLNMNVERVKE